MDNMQHSNNGNEVGISEVGDDPNNDGGGAPDGIPHLAIDEGDDEYKMDHSNRGFAVILNHHTFDKKLKLPIRHGTQVDAGNLKKRLQGLGFKVEVKRDLTKADVDKAIEELAKTDHRDCDCLVVVVLSHGGLGTVYARDVAYNHQELWEPFTASRCPSLAGKPKIFFIQACQGTNLDSGFKMTMGKRKTCIDTTDSGHHNVIIPECSDFLFAFSTIPGYYSWRNTQNGSWFIESVCYVLEKYWRTLDLEKMLVRVKLRVAYNYISRSDIPEMDQKKQIPSVTSRLARDVYFTPKQVTIIRSMDPGAALLRQAPPRRVLRSVGTQTPPPPFVPEVVWEQVNLVAHPLQHGQQSGVLEPPHSFDPSAAPKISAALPLPTPPSGGVPPFDHQEEVAYHPPNPLSPVVEPAVQPDIPVTRAAVSYPALTRCTAPSLPSNWAGQ